MHSTTKGNVSDRVEYRQIVVVAIKEAKIYNIAISSDELFVNIA